MARPKLCGIYCIWLFDGRCYVGQSIDILTRWQKHRNQLGQRTQHSEYFYRVWHKYGPNAFTFDIVEECDISQMTDEEAEIYLTEREQYWMDITFSCLNGTPTAGRSCLGRKDTVATKEKKRAAMTGRDHWWGHKISASKMGHEVSEATRQILREQRLGIPLPAEHATNISKALKGKSKKGHPQTPETRALISAASKAMWERRRLDEGTNSNSSQ